MSIHTKTCGAPGKFDCWADEKLYEMTLEFGEGEGSVDAPTGWFAHIELDLSNDEEADLFEHYGTYWFIVRENEQGFFSVHDYIHEEERDADLEELRERYAAWEGGDL